MFAVNNNFVWYVQLRKNGTDLKQREEIRCNDATFFSVFFFGEVRGEVSVLLNHRNKTAGVHLVSQDLADE